MTGRDTVHQVLRMLRIKFQLRWTKSYLYQTVTTRNHLGTGEESDFGENDHKVAQFIFITKRKMQEHGQRDAGPRWDDFEKHAWKPWVAPGWAGGLAHQGRALRDTACLSYQEEGRKHNHQPQRQLCCCKPRAEGGGNHESSLHICSQNCPIAKPCGEAWMSFS